MMNDTTNRYGAITRLLHWLMAILIILQFLKLGDRIDDGEHWIGQTIVPWHVSLGVVLLLFFVLRLAWAWAQRHNRPHQVGPIALLVKSGHALLYVCMFLMPVTGIFRIVGKGNSLKVFGMQLVPKTGEKIEWMISLGNLHSPISWIFVALVIGHIGAALFHHFVIKDNTLRRMTGGQPVSS